MPSKDKSSVTVHDLLELLERREKADLLVAGLLAKIDANVQSLKSTRVLIELVLLAAVLILACKDVLGDATAKIILAILGLAGAAIGVKTVKKE